MAGVIPQDHELMPIARAIDFGFVDAGLGAYYAEAGGRPAYIPRRCSSRCSSWRPMRT
jgi:hypothetical protein